MRVLVKGGVWKNSEDEILKAGVMKYGKNEWGRIATLLPRKTAKQCKRRWLEWLDPMIKKTEWTREEDEKLLHLAKLMPTQWRTIAPIVGRTPGQCLERYGKLLDLAAGGDTLDGEDARKLRVGEFDPNPEDKPARPDPIDMDEDEKEMLGEAKARLANIGGKKAKRKARERLLENARRMAKLQKYRELKAAGVGGSTSAVLGGKRSQNKRELDFANEIPFEREVPIGFYDTSEEREDGIRRALTEESRKRLLETANEEPHKRAKKEREAAQRERERFDKLAKENLDAAMKEIEERNNPFGSFAIRKGTKMVLPEPQVTDSELEDIARLGRKLRIPKGSSSTSSSSSSVVLSELDGSYKDQTPSLSRVSSSVRTPVAPDVVLEEARNQRARTTAQTPLLGGENASTTTGTGFEGHAPSVRSVATPSVYTPSVAKQSVDTSASRSSQYSVNTLRDQFHINAEEAEPIEAMISKQELKEQKKEALFSLRSQLNSLPAPKYSYEVSFASKDMDNDDEEGKQGQVLDAADEEKVKELKRKHEKEEQLRNQSEVLKRGLPLPSYLDPKLLSFKAPMARESEKKVAKLIQDSFVETVQRDINEECVKRSKEEKQYLEDAKAQIDLEATSLFGETYKNMNANQLEKAFGGASDRYLRLAAAIEMNSGKSKKAKDQVVVRGPFQQLKACDATAEQRIESLRAEFYMIQNAIQQVEANSRKAEKVLERNVFGLRKRAMIAAEEFTRSQELLDVEIRNLATFKFMRDSESASIPAAIKEWQDLVRACAKVEEALQTAYYELYE